MGKRLNQAKLYLIIGILLCALVLSLSFGCTEQSPSATGVSPTTPKPAGPKYGGIMRFSDYADGVGIGYPSRMQGVVSMRYAAPAIEPLFGTDKNGGLIPLLATDYKNDVTAKTITLSIRKGVKFHDGTDLNAEAVKWNLDECTTNKLAGTQTVKSIELVDDYTVKINLSIWDSTFISYLTQQMGMIISPTSCKKNGVDWAMNNPVGTGPFQFVSWAKDSKIVYKKFPGYWQSGKPYLDEIQCIPIVDTQTRLLSFKSKELDLALYIEVKDVANLEKEGYIISRQSVGCGAVNFVFDSATPNSPFADVRVRQATTYAIDNKTINQAVSSGVYISTNQWTYPEHWAYNPSIAGYPYNPTKAKQLLTDAGYANGFKSKIYFDVTSKNDVATVAIQNYLKVIGIDITIDSGERARTFSYNTGGATWEGLMQGTFLPQPDVLAGLRSRYGSAKTFVSMIRPADYIKALDDGAIATDFETKRKSTQEAMRLLIDKYCLILPLHCQVDLGVGQINLKNHNFYTAPNSGWWTPYDAWLDK